MAAHTTFAFHLLGADGSRYELEPGRDVLIGRGEDCLVHLSDALASRIHARLRWDVDRLWMIEDLDSANGTWLDDRKLRQAQALHDGAVIRIGGVRLTYRLVPAGATAPVLDVEDDPFAGEQTVAVGLATVALGAGEAAAEQGFAGSFSDWRFRDVVRFLAMAGRSGELVHDGSPMRTITFRDGVPRRAACGNDTGMPALRALAERPGEHFQFSERRIGADDDEIAGSAEEVLFACFGADGADDEEMASDLARARDVQERLLARLPSIDGWSLGLHYQGLHQVSGDYYDVGPLPDGRMLVVLGDVSGHGVQAALVVAWIVRSLRQLRQQTSDLGDLLSRLNDEVRPDLLPGQFSTLAAAAIDTVSGAAEVALCGHHPWLLVEQGQVREVGNAGMALGLADGTSFATRLAPSPVQLEVGAILVQATDGILEASDGSGEEYGMHRLRSSLLEAEGDPQDLVNWAAASVRGWARRIDDDLTLCALRRDRAVASNGTAAQPSLDLSPRAAATRKPGAPAGGAGRSLARVPSLARQESADSSHPDGAQVILPQRRIIDGESADDALIGGHPDYRLRELLHKDQGSVRYRADQVALPRPVIVHLLASEHETAAVAAARLAARCAHPGVRVVHDIGRDPERGAFIAWEPPRGRPWSALIARLGRLGNLAILGKLCDALAHAHECGVIHRDCKPAQVVVGHNGEAVLGGWDLAAFVGADSADNAGLPRPLPGAVVGTPAYMPPELARGDSERHDERSDIYLLGAILFEILSGEPPHAGDDTDETLLAAASNAIVATPELDDDPLMAVARGALASDPDQRPVSVPAFKHALEQARR